jgi:2-keto-4-pentenoate hydratase/2-oxohepta-3-ene-1,7-dioic acid hydratase in catechol pathway
MTWNVAELVRFVDERSSFDCGDVLYTGSPEGTGQARALPETRRRGGSQCRGHRHAAQRGDHRAARVADARRRCQNRCQGLMK